MKNLFSYVDKNNLIYFVAAIACAVLFLFSFESKVTAGDKLSYRNYYEAAKQASFLEGYSEFKTNLNSKEPGYFVVSYAFTKVVDKYWFDFLLNFSLFLLMITFLIRAKVYYFWFFLLFSNFYVYVLLFSAERLKLAAIFFMLACFVSKNIYKWIFISFAILTHVQIILMLPFYIFYINGIPVKNLLKRRKNDLIYYSIAGLLLISLFDHISKKIIHYLPNGSFLGAVKAMLFLLIAWFSVEDKSKKTQVIFSHVPLILAAFLLGSDRIIILSFFITSAIVLQNKKMLIPYWFIGAYFSIKGFFFLLSVELVGQGFLWINVGIFDLFEAIYKYSKLN